MNRIRLHVWLFVVAFGALVIVQAVGNLVCGNLYYAYRAWEAAVADGFYPFRPLFVWDRLSYGDLSHMAGVPQLRHYKHERFTTDEYGFRNPVGTYTGRMNVVIVGDSVTGGAGCSDDDILSGQIRRKTNLSVYNYGNSTMALFLGDTRFRGNWPDIVIWYAAGGFDPAYLGLQWNMVPNSPRRWQSWDSELLLPRRTGGKSPGGVGQRFNDRFLKHHAEVLYKGLLYATGLFTVPSNMVLDKERRCLRASSSGVISESDFAVPEALAKVVTAYEREFRKMGMRLVVVKPPWTSMLYASEFPAPRNRDDSVLLERFQSQLDRGGTDYVNVLAIYTEYHRRHPDADIYQPDDTHPTKLGYSLVFDAVAQKLGWRTK